MIAFHYAYVDAVSGEGSPSHVVPDLSEERLRAGAEQHNPAGVGLRPISHQGVEEGFEPSHVPFGKQRHAEAVADVGLAADTCNERRVMADPWAKESGFAPRADHEIRHVRGQ
jgi:hypothetical protein